MIGLDSRPQGIGDTPGDEAIFTRLLSAGPAVQAYGVAGRPAGSGAAGTGAPAPGRRHADGRGGHRRAAPASGRSGAGRVRGHRAPSRWGPVSRGSVGQGFAAGFPPAKTPGRFLRQCRKRRPGVAAGVPARPRRSPGPVRLLFRAR
jgi:hypothetical protein